MERRGVLMIFAFILLALASGWLLRSLTPSERDGSQIFSGKPDYYFNGAIITRFNKQGRPLFNLHADSATHYPDDDRTELENVQVTYTRDPGTPWHISATSGLIPGGQEIVKMTGGVTITELEASSTPFTLNTDYLQINTDTNLLTTDADVRITQGNSQVTGQGLEADLDNEWFVLNSHVQANYLR